MDGESDSRLVVDFVVLVQEVATCFSVRLV